ncbi:TadE/TadG family type IV pilus assembly protein [Spongorhabdus nitratireducens]
MATQPQSVFRQQGVAALMFILVLPLLMYFLVLGLEGGRNLYIKSRLNDAVVAARKALEINQSNDQTLNIKVVSVYIAAYIPDARINDVQVSSSNCTSHLCDGKTYNIIASVLVESLFPEINGFGFPQKTPINSSPSKK